MRHEYRTVDAHVAGAPATLLIAGVPKPAGATPDKQRTWLERHGGPLRRAALAEPRGHIDLVGVLLTEPTSPDADAGLLFMDGGGFPPLSGTALAAAVTIAIERGLISKPGVPPPDARRHVIELRFDTPAGLMSAQATLEQDGSGTRVRSVRTRMAPAFALSAGCDVNLGARHVRADLAYASGFYAIVDSEATGIPLIPARASDLRRLGRELCAALRGHRLLVHPGAASAQLEGVILTSQPLSSDAHLRVVTVLAHGGCDRSPGGAAMAAVMAVLNAMELLRPSEPFVGEGLVDLTGHGTIVETLRVNDRPAVVVDLESTAWITGERTLVVDDDDPLRPMEFL